jgi:hypothetical protein
MEANEAVSTNSHSCRLEALIGQLQCAEQQCGQGIRADATQELADALHRLVLLVSDSQEECELQELPDWLLSPSLPLPSDLVARVLLQPGCSLQTFVRGLWRRRRTVATDANAKLCFSQCSFYVIVVSYFCYLRLF